MSKNGLFLFLILLLSCNVCYGSRLLIDWPEGWVLAKPIVNGKTLLIQGQQEDANGDLVQTVELLTVRLEGSKKSISDAGRDIKKLAESLLEDDLKSDKSSEDEAALNSFNRLNGYYYYVDSGNDSETSLRYKLVGAVVHEGYLLNILVRTDNVSSVETRAVLAAFEKLNIMKASNRNNN